MMMNMRGLTFDKSYFTTMAPVETIAFVNRTDISRTDVDSYCLDENDAGAV